MCVFMWFGHENNSFTRSCWEESKLSLPLLQEQGQCLVNVFWVEDVGGMGGLDGWRDGGVGGKIKEGWIERCGRDGWTAASGEGLCRRSSQRIPETLAME